MFSRPWRHLESHKMHRTSLQTFMGDMPLIGNDWNTSKQCFYIYFLTKQIQTLVILTMPTKWCAIQFNQHDSPAHAILWRWSLQRANYEANLKLPHCMSKRFAREWREGTNEKQVEKSIASSHEYKRIQMHKCGYHGNVLQFICRRNWQSFDRSALSNHRPVIRSVSYRFTMVVLSCFTEWHVYGKFYMTTNLVVSTSILFHALLIHRRKTPEFGGLRPYGFLLLVVRVQFNAVGRFLQTKTANRTLSAKILPTTPLQTILAPTKKNRIQPQMRWKCSGWFGLNFSSSRPWKCFTSKNPPLYQGQ